MDSVVFILQKKCITVMNTSDRTVRETQNHIQAEWHFLCPHACPCSTPNKSHVIHSLRPCRNSPSSKTKLNSHTTFWDHIWFERYLHVCKYSHYNSLNAVTTTSIMKWEAVHLMKSATQLHIPQKSVTEQKTRYFLLHLYNSHPLFSFVSLITYKCFGKKKFLLLLT